MNDIQKFFFLALLVTLGILVYLLSPVLTPFITAAILAYMADPLADRLEALGLPRTLAVSLVFVTLSGLALLALFILIPLVQQQVILFANTIPAYLAYVKQHLLPWLQAQFGIDPQMLDLETLEKSIQADWRSATGVVGKLMLSITKSGIIIGNLFMNLTIIAVVTFYLLRDWDRLVAAVRELFPRRIEPTVSLLARESDEVLGAFLRGQLLVMLGLGIIYSSGLAIIGLDLALLIGMLAGVVSFVPYLGFIIGIVVAGIAALMQFHDLTHLLYVLAVFGVGQVLESVLLTPLLVGDRIGLHPVAVIFAVLAGGQLFGFVGVLLALPVSAVIAVILRYMHKRYRESDLYAMQKEEGT